MNKLLLFTIVFLIVGGGALLLQNRQKTNNQAVENTPTSTQAIVTSEPKPIDYRAGFAIFTQGTYRIFTDPKYHNRSADVFLHADNPNIVRVKKSSITWGDFFKTLPMELRKDCLVTGTKQTFCSNESEMLKFYINGERVEDFLEKEINDRDRALVSYGPPDDPEIPEQLNNLNSISFPQ